MDEQKNFTMHLNFSPSPFFFNAPNVGFYGGNIDSHLPTLIERRLDDLGDHYFLMMRSYNHVFEIKEKIGEQYDPDENSLNVGVEYWDLVLFLNNFLFEARTTLDLLAVVLQNVYGKKGKGLPRSFNDIKEAGKHADVFVNDPIFYESLLCSKKASWMKFLLTNDGKTSLRDRTAHYTLARLSIYSKGTSRELSFDITANMKGGHPMGPNPSLELSETITSIRNGMSQLLTDFRKNYTQQRIRELLDISDKDPGMFA